MAKKVDYGMQLSSIHYWSALTYTLLAVIASFVMGQVSHQITLGHLAKDELASRSSAAIVPGAQVVFDAQLKWLVIATLLLGVVVPGLYMTRLQKSYAKSLKKKNVTWRWIDMAVASALMVEVIALLSGVQDLAMLKLIGGLMVITCTLGWLGERAVSDAKKMVRPLFILSLVTGSLPWFVIFAQAIATPFYASIRAPWYVYALYVTMLGSFSMIAFTQWSYYGKAKKQWKNFRFVERNYVMIMVIARVLFAAVLIIGLRK